LRGRIAIANAKVAYQRYLALKQEPEIAALLIRGVRPQRPLWASTSTKDKRYSDVLYVEALIGPETVNTLPPETLDAFVYHGTASYSLEAEADFARHELEALGAQGIALTAVTKELEVEGVNIFRDSWDKLLAALADKCSAVTKDFAG
jgi:transaldolase/glucose-6-phosphate isomerase